MARPAGAADEGAQTMIIATDELSKVYRTKEVETTALDGVRVEVSAGEFVALMGPSGCGKSTLMHILGLIDTPSSGSYKLLGEEMSRRSRRERTQLRKANLGFVFQ